MSRIGKIPVALEAGVKVSVDSQNAVHLQREGKSLCVEVDPVIEVLVKDGKVFLKRKNDLSSSRAFHGLYRMLIQNAVTGLSKGWKKTLLFKGVGYKMQVSGSSLEMHLGYSHPVKMKVPEGLKVEVGKNSLSIEGVDKAQVGQFAAQVRSLREPEPYLGKGIRYSDEVLRRKAGKSGGEKK